MVLGGMHLPYGPGDWYWFSSRIFPPGYNEFYEFPVFSFIWSDLHAHMIALMLTVLAISWALSVLLAKARWNNPLNAVIGFFMGGLIIGSLKPTNTWDFYTYIVFGAVVLAYTVWRYSNPGKNPPAIARLGETSVPDRWQHWQFWAVFRFCCTSRSRIGLGRPTLRSRPGRDRVHPFPPISPNGACSCSLSSPG